MLLIQSPCAGWDYREVKSDRLKLCPQFDIQCSGEKGQIRNLLLYQISGLHLLSRELFFHRHRLCLVVFIYHDQGLNLRGLFSLSGLWSIEIIDPVANLERKFLLSNSVAVLLLPVAVVLDFEAETH